MPCQNNTVSVTSFPSALVFSAYTIEREQYIRRDILIHHGALITSSVRWPQGKPIFESPHVWTGLGGLSLLALQVGTAWSLAFLRRAAITLLFLQCEMLATLTLHFKLNSSP